MILIIFLFTSVFLALNPILTTDKSSRNQSSEDSPASDKKSPQYPLTSTWILNGTPVITETYHQLDPKMCSDDEGGAIIVWEDDRTGGHNFSIYAQKINSAGDIVWTSFPDGVPIWTNTSTSLVKSQICSDGEGGAIITWMDNRSGGGSWSHDIYAQRINSTGGLEWTPQGVPICINSSLQERPRIISVDSGGAIITWEDTRLGNTDIFAQRVDSDGNKMWYWKLSDPWDGIPVCTQTNDQYFMGTGGTICSDGADGAIITWNDKRTGFYNVSVYAQRIDFNGNRYWALNGEAICTITNTWMNPSPKIISDDEEGAVIAWNDNRTGGTDRYHDIYAQRVNSTGDTQWTDQGVGICTAAFDQTLTDITYDGANGAIIIWKDNRDGIYSDLYSQKVNSIGEIQWTPNGVDICTEEKDQYNAKICNDGMGGIFAVWVDERDVDNEEDIYVQHINSKGISQWTTDGVIVCNENDEQDSPEIICNAAGSAIIVWEDYRSGTNDDIYAYRVIDKEPKPSIPPPSDDDDDDDDDEEIEFLVPTLLLIGFISAIGVASVVIYLFRKRKST